MHFLFFIYLSNLFPTKISKQSKYILCAARIYEHMLHTLKEQKDNQEGEGGKHFLFSLFRTPTEVQFRTENESEDSFRGETFSCLLMPASLYLNFSYPVFISGYTVVSIIIWYEETWQFSYYYEETDPTL